MDGNAGALRGKAIHCLRKIIGAHHFVANLTLPYGRVLYDYNKA